MNTVENAGILWGAVLNLYNLHFDVRNCATSWKRRVAAGETPATIAADILSRADAFLYRCGLHTSLVGGATGGPKFAAGLAMFNGLLNNDFGTEITAISAAANALKFSALDTAAEITAACDALLAAIPAWDSVIPLS